MLIICSELCSVMLLLHEPRSHPRHRCTWTQARWDLRGCCRQITASMGVRAVMGVRLLLLVWAVGAGAPDPVCIPGCTCDPQYLVFLEPAHTTFQLRCDVRNAGDELAWSRLGPTSRQLTVRLDFQQAARLGREHLPQGRAVVCVEVRGVSSVASDALHNVQGSLLSLKLVMTSSAPAWTMPFLLGLSRLKRLHLDYDYHAKDAQPANVTGTPFKGSNLRLEKLFIYGGNIATLGPDFFLGLAATEVNIGSNGLSSFPWNALAKMGGLKKLEVYNNSVPHMEDGATDGLRLEQLVLKRTRTETMAAGALRGVRHWLRKLLVVECRLREVPVDALSPLEKLQTLTFTDNPIAAFARPLYGSVCPTWLSVDSYEADVSGLASMHPGAFRAVGGCLEHVSLSGTRLPRFPTDAFRDLAAAGSIYLGSAALTRLHSGALQGVSVRVLTIEAPLDDIEPGAFSGMRHYPVSLTLRSTNLANASFFYDYPGRTFSSLSIASTHMDCSCELEGIRRNLEEHKVGWRKEKALSMNCYSSGRLVFLQTRQTFVDLFSNCTNFTILEPREISAGGAARGLVAPLLLLAALLVTA